MIGVTSAASKEQAEQAIEAAARAFESWRRLTLAGARASTFSRRRRCCANVASNTMRCWSTRSGKSWPEADGDIAEAIDFLEFYAREALRYAQPQPVVPMAGEQNELVYIPLGVGAVIPPWNFAGAIMIGMTAAAIVSGNTVVLKPSSDAAIIAAWFVDLLARDRRAPGVVNFVPGSGSEIGDLIVTHPQIRFISFTGSKEVGLRINELAAKPQPGQKWIKRVVAEMGGKDSIVVAADADVDAAVEGVAVSAFGFQGPEVLGVLARHRGRERLRRVRREAPARASGKITVGDPSDPPTYMGPVVNEAALRSIMGYIEKGQREGRLITGGKRVGRDAATFWSRRSSPTSRPMRPSHKRRSSVRCWPSSRRKTSTMRWRSRTTPSSG